MPSQKAFPMHQDVAASWCHRGGSTTSVLKRRNVGTSNYRHLFPNLCCRTRFNRTRRALLQVTELLRQKINRVFPVPCSRYFVIDSFPLPVCKFGRARYCRSFRLDGADYGKCPSKKRRISALRSMLWSRWKDISQRLRLLRRPWMIGKGFVTWRRTALAWLSLGTKAIQGSFFGRIWWGRGSVWCHWNLPIIKRTGRRRWDSWSFVSAEGSRPYFRNSRNRWMVKESWRKVFVGYAPDCKTRF